MHTYKRLDIFSRTALILPKEPRWTITHFLIEISLGRTQSLPPSLLSQQLSSLAGCQTLSGSAGDVNADLLKLSHILLHVYHSLPRSGTEARSRRRRARADTAASRLRLLMSAWAEFRKTQERKTAEDTWFQAHCQRSPEWKGHSLKCQALVIGKETSAWEAAVWR